MDVLAAPMCPLPRAKLFHFGEPFGPAVVFDSIPKFCPDVSAADLPGSGMRRARLPRSRADVKGFRGAGKFAVMNL